MPQAHLLVVDDQEANRILMSRQLTRIGLTVDAVADGPTAIATAMAGSYDLLITDCHMPIMDGIELARTLRAAEAERGRVRMPILGLTGDARSEIRAKCIAAGMNAVEFKPIRLPSLRAALLDLLTSKAPSAPVAPVVAGNTANFESANYCELYERGDQEGAQWLQSYLESVSRLVVDLRQTVEQTDLDGTVVAAHTLSGNSLIAGAARMGAVSRELEDVALAGDWTAIRRLVGEVFAAADAAKREILNFLSQANGCASC